MGEFKKNLQEKVNSRRDQVQKKLTVEERLRKEYQKLNNALVFLEKIILEAKEGWRIDSCKELTGQELAEKFGVFRKKPQQKSLHWYLEAVCDDQSVYNQKILRVLTAMEDFAKAQMDWNRVLEERYEAEMSALRDELSAMKGEMSGDER